MLDYSIMKPEGILILKPDTPLSKGDFGRLTAAVDSYLAYQGVLQGVLVVAKGFPGWENCGAFTAHMHFVREHERKERRVAIVTDSYFGGVFLSEGLDGKGKPGHAVFDIEKTRPTALCQY